MTDPVDHEREVQKRTTHLWVTSYAEPMELQSFAGVTSPCDIECAFLCCCSSRIGGCCYVEV